MPVIPFSTKEELVDELLRVVKKWFRIGLVLFDREFSKDSKILKVVEKHGLKYLASMEKYEGEDEITGENNDFIEIYSMYVAFKNLLSTFMNTGVSQLFIL